MKEENRKWKAERDDSQLEMLWGEGIHNCSCSVHFLCQQIHIFWILKDSFERFLAGPCWPISWKLFWFSPLSQVLWHFNGWEFSACLWSTLSDVLFPEGSASFKFQEGTSELSKSLHHSASTFQPSPSTGLLVVIPPPANQWTLLSHCAPWPPTHSLIPPFPSQFLCFGSLLVSLTAGVESPSHVTDTLTCLAWNKINHFMDHFATACGW